MQLTLDTPVDGALIAGLVVHVQGWAYDEDSPVSTVEILFDGRSLGPAALAWPRPDVAEYLGDPGLGLCGFARMVTPPPAMRTAGRHSLVVRARLLDGRVLSTEPVAVELPAVPEALDEPSAPGVDRAAEPIRTFWLARSLDRGGSQLRMAETLEHLQRAGGWTATVLSPFDGPLRDRVERAGAEVRLIDPVPFADVVAYRAAVKRLVHELADADLAVAPTVTSFPLVHAARLAGVPAVQRVGESAALPIVVEWLGQTLDPGVEALARRAIRGAQAIWTNSHAVERCYRNQGYDGAWAVIHTGRPAIGPPVPREEARRRLGLPTDGRLLVFAGTIWPIKGQGLLIEALRVVRREHPDLRVAMVGQDDNPYTASLRDHLVAHDLTDRVVLAPFEDDLSTWWAAADAVALASTLESEALSSALVEGMAHGLPALATRSGDAEVMVEDGHSGWLAEPDELGSLVDALRRAGSADLATWRRYGSNAAERCAQEPDRRGALDTVTRLLQECVHVGARSGGA